MPAALHRVVRRSWQFIAGVAIGAALMAQPTWASFQQPTTIPIAWMAPPGVVQISPCVPHMGEHWADPATLPMGPIYTVDQGRLISIEYMPAQADFAEGKSWNDLTFTYWGQPLPIRHADIDFLAHGHEGFEVRTTTCTSTSSATPRTARSPANRRQRQPSQEGWFGRNLWEGRA